MKIECITHSKDKYFFVIILFQWTTKWQRKKKVTSYSEPSNSKIYRLSWVSANTNLRNIVMSTGLPLR